MRLCAVLGHIVLVVIALTVLVGLPVFKGFGLPAGDGSADAVSSATIPLPDQPSGRFLVLINTDRHRDTVGDWKSFFLDEDFPVIFEVISCLVAAGDVSGRQLAERYQIQLPENQLTLREENPTLLVSKAEAGMIDVAVFSAEMADALKLSPDTALLTVIEVKGGEE